MLKRIVGTIGWIGTAVVFAAVAVRFLYPAWERYSYWMAWAGLACIVVYAAGQWREIAQAFTKRGTRLGSAAAAGILVALGIVIAVNYLGARENKRWDLTSAREFTLSDQTQKLLSRIDAPLKMIVFARSTDFQRYQASLAEYPYTSKKVSVEYVDPDQNPERARQYQIQTYGTIALVYKTRTERVVSDSEQDVANGLIKVITGEQKKVYFVQGHDEHDTAAPATDAASYSAIAAALTRENYGVDKLVLAQRAEVPADASVVVVAGPKVDFLPSEVDALRRYLQKGGKLLLLLDPPEKTDSPPLTNLVALAHEWDIAVNNDIVVDPVGQMVGMGPLSPISGPPYPSFPITERFRLNAVFSLVRSVTLVAGGVNGHNAQSFVQTGADSYATDAQPLLKAIATASADNRLELKQKDSDKAGPISIAAAVSAPVAQKAAVEPANQKNEPGKPTPETRVAVFGDSDFVSNNYIGATRGNANLFMNTIGWLAQQENLISIRPHEADDRRLSLTAGSQRLLMLLSLLVIPAMIFGTGVYTWWRRR